MVRCRNGCSAREAVSGALTTTAQVVLHSLVVASSRAPRLLPGACCRPRLPAQVAPGTPPPPVLAVSTAALSASTDTMDLDGVPDMPPSVGIEDQEDDEDDEEGDEDDVEGLAREFGDMLAR